MAFAHDRSPLEAAVSEQRVRFLMAPGQACASPIGKLIMEMHQCHIRFGDFPICVAKTQYSFTTDPAAKGVPLGHTIPIREVRLSAGAEFVVVICGAIMTLPGLPRVPAANNIELASDGRISGLF